MNIVKVTQNEENVLRRFGHTILKDDVGTAYAVVQDVKVPETRTRPHPRVTAHRKLAKSKSWAQGARRLRKNGDISKAWNWLDKNWDHEKFPTLSRADLSDLLSNCPDLPDYRSGDIISKLLHTFYFLESQ